MSTEIRNPTDKVTREPPCIFSGTVTERTPRVVSRTVPLPNVTYSIEKEFVLRVLVQSERNSTLKGVVLMWSLSTFDLKESAGISCTRLFPIPLLWSN